MFIIAIFTIAKIIKREQLSKIRASLTIRSLICLNSADKMSPLKFFTNTGSKQELNCIRMNTRNDSGGIVLFDSDCMFCCRSVRLLLNADRKQKLLFMPLRDAMDAGTGLQKIFPGLTGDSLVFIRNGRLYLRSEAALELCRLLGGWWSIFRIFRIIPVKLRDVIYNFTASHRHLLPGGNNCILPSQITPRLASTETLLTALSQNASDVYKHAKKSPFPNDDYRKD